MLDPALQSALRERPKGRAAMRQSWRDLTFLHFSVEPESIQATLPKGLTVDTFDGKAWVGLVPFWMTGVRLSGWPAIYGTHTFPETNVRTYVHREGHAPGVWFYSLDAANGLAVKVARAFFHLPYFRAAMAVDRQTGMRYSSRRRHGSADHEIEVEVGAEIKAPQPGSLEFFLIERYLLYAAKNGRLFSGQVHHPPYPLCTATVRRYEQTMIQAAGLPALPWEHVCYSPGVDVDVFPLRAVG